MGSSPCLLAAARRLDSMVAVITGGASGIGECTARLFHRHGAKVVVADVQDELGRSVCNDLGPAASFVHCNVTDEGDVSSAIDHAVAKFGKLDIMFNGAGITGSRTRSIVEDSKADLERVLVVNVVGPFLGTKHAARVMIPARRGSIISMASLASASGGVANHDYTSSKHAVVGLTRSAAADLGRYGIRVNCISPSYIATPLVTTFLGQSTEEIDAVLEAVGNLRGPRLRTEDVAKAALYLGSDDSGYVSGHNLLLDGGDSVINHLLGLYK